MSQKKASILPPAVVGDFSLTLAFVASTKQYLVKNQFVGSFQDIVLNSSLNANLVPFIDTLYKYVLAEEKKKTGVHIVTQHRVGIRVFTNFWSMNLAVFCFSVNSTFCISSRRDQDRKQVDGRVASIMKGRIMLNEKKGGF